MKQVIILRGISGSGKSTHGRRLAGDRGVICSADDFFMVDGEYKFDFGKLQDAHSACFRKFLAALEAGTETVIVDNTNTQAWEISPYKLAGESFGYSVKIVEVKCDPEVAAARNTHGVPREGVLKMAARMAAEQLPPRWKVEVVS